MRKEILNIGKALNKAEQQKINGGTVSCNTDSDCPKSAPGGSGCNPFCANGTCIWSLDCND